MRTRRLRIIGGSTVAFDPLNIEAPRGETHRAGLSFAHLRNAASRRLSVARVVGALIAMAALTGACARRVVLPHLSTEEPVTIVSVVDTSIVPGFTLRGVVTQGSEDRAVDSAYVSLYDPIIYGAREFAHAVTDSSGHFEIRAPRAGRFVVYIAGRGYQPTGNFVLFGAGYGARATFHTYPRVPSPQADSLPGSIR